jgi:hypothetical protein
MDQPKGRIKTWWRRHDGRPRTRAAVLTGMVIALLAAPIGVAATGDSIRLGKKNSAAQETSIVSNEREDGGGTGGYTTRQSNTSSSGGGAIYGCRARTGDANNPCLRVNNLSTGKAFELAFRGLLGGTIETGTPGDTAKPFTTNATGVADGLNADRVDGNNADQLKTRWLILNEAGQIEAQSGGFTVLDAYQTNQNVYVDAGQNVSAKGFSATIALQNKIDQSGDGQADANFGGEVSIAPCQTASVECAPANSKTPNAFAVAPRNSDGTATAAGTRKRVYVTISE